VYFPQFARMAPRRALNACDVLLSRPRTLAKLEPHQEFAAVPAHLLIATPLLESLFDGRPINSMSVRQWGLSVLGRHRHGQGGEERAAQVPSPLPTQPLVVRQRCAPSRRGSTLWRRSCEGAASDACCAAVKRGCRRRSPMRPAGTDETGVPAAANVFAEMLAFLFSLDDRCVSG